MISQKLVTQGKIIIYHSLGSPLSVQFLLPQTSLHSVGITSVIRANCKPLLGHLPRARACVKSPQMLHSFEPPNSVNYLFNYYPYFIDEETEAKKIQYLVQIPASE